MAYPSEWDILTQAVCCLHRKIRSAVRARVSQGKALLDHMSEESIYGDVAYPVDIGAHSIIDSFFSTEWREFPIRVIAEGMRDCVYPKGCLESNVRFCLLVDPIDGTREIMYNKRSAWVLTGIASAKRSALKLSDITYAIQTEIPCTKQEQGSVLFASRGQGCTEEIWDIKHSTILSTKQLQSSKALDLNHGFAVFFDPLYPGPRLQIANLSYRILAEILTKSHSGHYEVFNDQWLSTAGQIYLLASGVYRLVVDARPLFGINMGQILYAHPYDLATILIATEAGAIVTDLYGKDLSYPLDVSTPCGWIGYANSDIRGLVEDNLLKEIKIISNDK